MKFEKIKASIEIRKPPQSVFKFLIQIEPRLRLNPSYTFLSLEFLTPGPPQVGSRYRVKVLLKKGGIVTYESMILELEKDRKLVTQEVNNRFRISLILDPTSKGTLLTQTEEFVLPEEVLRKKLEEELSGLPKFLRWLFRLDRFSLDELQKRKLDLLQELTSELKIWLERIKEEIENNPDY